MSAFGEQNIKHMENITIASLFFCRLGLCIANISLQVQLLSCSVLAGAWFSPSIKISRNV